MKPSRPSVLVAMSPFKGTLSNIEACAAVAEALKTKHIPSEVFPIADGGLGTLDTILSFFHGDIITIDASDPMGQKAKARVLCLPDRQSPVSVYIESAETCGYHLVKKETRDAMRASSHGLGETIKEVVKRWDKTLTTIYIGLGDSATSDMGMGMLCALGFRFFDASGHELWGNAHGLRFIRSMQVPDLSEFLKRKFIVLCDVLNPLLGPMGSAQIFSKQKGASSPQVHLIEEGMANFAGLIHEITGRVLRDEPLTGSAGGLSATLLSFFGAELVHGARFLLNWLKFENKFSKQALLITGEGKTDHQTVSGKASMVCLETARSLGIKSIVISGSLGQGYETLLEKELAVGIYQCGDSPTPKSALADKTLFLFSNPKFLKSIGYPA